MHCGIIIIAVNRTAVAAFDIITITVSVSAGNGVKFKPIRALKNIVIVCLKSSYRAIVQCRFIIYRNNIGLACLKRYGSRLKFKRAAS